MSTRGLAVGAVLMAAAGHDAVPERDRPDPVQGELPKGDPVIVAVLAPHSSSPPTHLTSRRW